MCSAYDLQTPRLGNLRHQIVSIRSRHFRADELPRVQIRSDDAGHRIDFRGLSGRSADPSSLLVGRPIDQHFHRLSDSPAWLSQTRSVAVWSSVHPTAISLTSSGTCPSILPIGVPGSALYGKTPIMSKPKSRTNSTNSRCCGIRFPRRAGDECGSNRDPRHPFPAAFPAAFRSAAASPAASSSSASRSLMC